MEDLIIEKDSKTPQVEFKTNGVLSITGISVIEDTMKFYQPIFEWLEEFLKNPPKEVSFKILFYYLNTSSLSAVYHLIKRLSEEHPHHINLKIIWQYTEADSDMLINGQVISEALPDAPIEIEELID